MNHLATPFRTFFIAAGACASACIALWYLALSGRLEIASELGPMGWHAHEMIFGYLGAVLVGFLLTAAASWTGLPTVGLPGTLGLLALWIAARCIHILDLGIPGSSWLECVFFLTAALGIGIPIVRSKRWNNFIFVVLLVLLGVTDASVHLAASKTISAEWGLRGLWIAIDVVAATILVFAGRILPLFTKNALGLAAVRAKGPLDFANIAALGILMLVHALALSARIEAVVWAITGLLTIARLYGWGGSKTLATPLLWVLHLGWFLMGAGMLLVAYALWQPHRLAPASAHHLLFVGGFGVVTLGMMARVALGHTGRTKVASRLATASFALLLVATAARLGASQLSPARYLDGLLVAALAWCAAFLAFLWTYAPVLLAPRSDGKPG